MSGKTIWFRKGLIDGIPIALGYFAVAFTLGIAAKKAGLTPFQASLASATTNASAGGYAGFSLISEKATYIELAITEFIVNARYLLMSCSLSQKLSPETSLLNRLIIAFDITDEIFGISVAVPGTLNPFYNYGAMTVTIPAWTLGTLVGVITGNILPSEIVSALSVGLFGMFIAIIVPPARKNKVIAGIVLSSMALSFLFSKITFINISEGLKIIIITIAISLLAAVLFPVKEDDDES